MDNVGVWDIETEGVGGDLVAVGWYDGVYNSSVDIQDFINYTLDSSVKTWYAHYAGRYDNLYLIDKINELKLRHSLLAINGKILPKIRHKKKIINFFDSYLLLPIGLSRLTREFDTPHKKLNYDDYNTHQDKTKMWTYLKNDVLSLYESLEVLVSTIKKIVGHSPNLSKKFTLPSIAFSILNKDYKAEQITRNFFTKELENWLKRSYYGGRTEVFKRYGECLYSYDVNSLYPHAMANFDYPAGRYKIIDGKRCIDFMLQGFLGVVECAVKAPDNLLIPLLPVRTDKGKIIFPIGQWLGVYTSPMLMKAMELGYEIQGIKGMFFSQRSRPFTSFVNDFYKLKQKSQGAKRVIAKLMLNSSYGKYAQKRIRQQVLSENDILRKGLDFWNEDYFFSKGYYIISKSNYANRMVNPLYAVFIVDYAKLEMYKWFERVGFEHVWYTDTDCIHTDVKLPTNNLLGGLKREHLIDRAVYIAPKTYAMECPDYVKIKAKGIYSEEAKYLSFDDMFNVLEGETFRIDKSKNMTGFKQSLRLRATRNKGFVNSIPTHRTIKDTFDKRKVLDNFNTLPLSYNGL